MSMVGNFGRKVDIRISADDRTKPAVESARRGLKRLGKDTGSVTNTMRASWMKVAAGIGGLMIAFRGLSRALGSVIELGLAHDQVYNDMAASLKRHNIEVDTGIERITEFAGSIQSLTSASDEVVVQALQRMIDSNIELENAIALTTLSQDLAVAKNMDFVTAADLVAKSIDSTTNALSRYGINLDSTLTGQAKINAMLDQLAGRFGGAAEARLGTLAGKIDEVGERFGDLQERIFDTFLEGPLTAVVDAASVIINEFGGDAGEKFANRFTRTAEEIMLEEATRIAAEQARILGNGAPVGREYARSWADAVLTGLEFIDDNGILHPFMGPSALSPEEAEAAKAKGKAFLEELFKPEVVEEERAAVRERLDALLGEPVSGAQLGGPKTDDERLSAQETVERELDEFIAAHQDTFSWVDQMHADMLENRGNREIEQNAREIALQAAKVEAAKQSVTSLGNILKAFNADQAKQSSIAFKAFQLVSIAEAVIDAHRAFSRALATGVPPFSYVQAAASLAMGLARVAAIRSTNPGSGGGGGGAVAIAAPIQPPPDFGNEPIGSGASGTVTNIHIAGNLVSMDELARELIPTLEQARLDGA